MNKLIFSFLLTLLFSKPYMVFGDDVNLLSQAYDLYKKGNVEQARNVWGQLAESGNVYAKFNLASLKAHAGYTGVFDHARNVKALEEIYSELDRARHLYAIELVKQDHQKYFDKGIKLLLDWNVDRKRMFKFNEISYFSSENLIGLINSLRMGKSYLGDSNYHLYLPKGLSVSFSSGLYRSENRFSVFDRVDRKNAVSATKLDTFTKFGSRYSKCFQLSNVITPKLLAAQVTGKLGSVFNSEEIKTLSDCAATGWVEFVGLYSFYLAHVGEVGDSQKQHRLLGGMRYLPAEYNQLWLGVAEPKNNVDEILVRLNQLIESDRDNLYYKYVYSKLLIESESDKKYVQGVKYLIELSLEFSWSEVKTVHQEILQLFRSGKTVRSRLIALQNEGLDYESWLMQLAENGVSGIQPVLCAYYYEQYQQNIKSLESALAVCGVASKSGSHAESMTMYAGLLMRKKEFKQSFYWVALIENLQPGIENKVEDLFVGLRAELKDKLTKKELDLIYFQAGKIQSNN